VQEPRLDDLVGAVVVLRDGRGNGGRYVVDHVHETTAVCTYVFRGRRPAPGRWRRGDAVELGAASLRGWIVASATVASGDPGATVALAVADLELVQRRRAYREDVVVPLVLRTGPDDAGRRGRTENLSHTGFAARLEGRPLPPGAGAWVQLAMPEGDELVLECRKVGGDLLERFELVGPHRAAQERLARLVRATELARRRADHVLE